jgi:hypothetical protein
MKIKLLKARAMLRKVLENDLLVTCPAYQKAFYEVFDGGHCCDYSQKTLDKVIANKHWQLKHCSDLADLMHDTIMFTCRTKTKYIERLFGVDRKKIQEDLYQMCRGESII